MNSKTNYENVHLMFPMIFQSLMGPGKLKCDVPSGTSQGHDCPIINNHDYNQNYTISSHVEIIDLVWPTTKN